MDGQQHLRASRQSWACDNVALFSDQKIVTYLQHYGYIRCFRLQGLNFCPIFSGPGSYCITRCRIAIVGKPTIVACPALLLGSSYRIFELLLYLFHCPENNLSRHIKTVLKNTTCWPIQASDDQLAGWVCQAPQLQIQRPRRALQVISYILKEQKWK